MMTMYLHRGPIVHALSSRPPYPRHWRSYVVLPQPRWDEKLKIRLPKTRPALPVPADAPSWVIGRRLLAEEKAMTVHDAEPGDVYVDDSGKLWRCIRPPKVSFEEVEATDATMDCSGAWVMQKQCREGALGDLMWNGWKRIWRKEKVEPRQKTQEWQDEYNKANGPIAM